MVKEKFGKTFGKASLKYYENGCLQNFLLLFVSLLTAAIIKNSHIYARIYFIFLKSLLKQT